jgi:hypothetical protein
MAWRCKLCETDNTDDSIICEVCEGISPVLSKFDYQYVNNGKVEICWQVENADKISVAFKGKMYDVTQWKSARLKVDNPISTIVLTLENETATRNYTIGIPYNKQI